MKLLIELEVKDDFGFKDIDELCKQHNLLHSQIKDIYSESNISSRTEIKYKVLNTMDISNEYFLSNKHIEETFILEDIVSIKSIRETEINIMLDVNDEMGEGVWLPYYENDIDKIVKDLNIEEYEKSKIKRLNISQRAYIPYDFTVLKVKTYFANMRDKNGYAITVYSHNREELVNTLQKYNELLKNLYRKQYI